jgi:hypothetical protein
MVCLEMLFIVVLTASLLGTASVNCAYGTSAFPRKAEVAVSTWGYDGLKGPLNWCGLNESANYVCDKGSDQSPIVIDSTLSVAGGSTVTNFSVPDYPCGAEFENLGTNVEAVVNGTLVDGPSVLALSWRRSIFTRRANTGSAMSFIRWRCTGFSSLPVSLKDHPVWCTGLKPRFSQSVRRGGLPR